MANEAQRDYWNTTAGLRWVEHQATMDHSLQDIGRVLFEHAAIRPGERVIDVGCGNGATTLEIARLVGPGGSVLGADISEPMLNAARQRTAGLGNVRLLAADAQTHAFEAGAHDLVMSRFGVMFFDQPAQAFGNLRRALKPGGRLRFVCWGPLKENPWFAIPLQVAARHFGPPEPVPPRAPGPLALSEPGYVTEILQAAGYVDVAIKAEHPFMLGHATVEEEAHFATIAGPLTRLLAAKQPDQAALAALAGDIAAALTPYVTPNGLRIPTTVFCVSATAP